MAEKVEAETGQGEARAQVVVLGCVDAEEGYAKAGTLAWDVPEEYEHFQATMTRVTGGGDGSSKSSSMIMGRKTWEAETAEDRDAFAERFACVCVLSRSNGSVEGDVASVDAERWGQRVVYCGSVADALCHLSVSVSATRTVLVLGGGEVYRAVLEGGLANTVLLSRLPTAYGCDQTMSDWLRPALRQRYRLAQVTTRDDEAFVVQRWERVRSFLFTSESTTEGHPDKICDQISDAVLDACLAQDPMAKVACETALTTNTVMVFGEITTTASLSFETIVRNTIRDIGYDDVDKGLDYRSMTVTVALHCRSPETRQVDGSASAEEEEGKQSHEQSNGDEDAGNDALASVGAGDQGIMFGYATDETPSAMPASHDLATRLTARLSEARRTLPEMAWLRPVGKAQVTIEYEEREEAAESDPSTDSIDASKQGGTTVSPSSVKTLLRPRRIHTIVMEAQHDPGVDIETVRSSLKRFVIDAVLAESDILCDDTCTLLLNKLGPFTHGGIGGGGLTGRKIIVDTYGGWASHGGGAFSGKDFRKVDRTAAYAARWVAKSLVKAGLCRRVLVQIAYCIGVAAPVSIHVNSYGTAHGVLSDEALEAIVRDKFDLRPGRLVRALGLQKPVFQRTAAHGHFGRSEFTWEQPLALL